MVLGKWVRAHWLRILVHAGALLPLAWLGWKLAGGAFIIDPVREITALTGRGALILLFLSLSCTPLNTLFGFKQALRVRRSLGLYAFAYISLHFITFVGLDYRLNLDQLQQAIFDQPYVLLGSTAGLLLIPLAITSTRGWQKRLGKRWKRLHRLVYPAAIIAVVHFLWLVKDVRIPQRYAIVLFVLLVLRLPAVRRSISRARYRLTAAR